MLQINSNNYIKVIQVSRIFKFPFQSANDKDNMKTYPDDDDDDDDDDDN